MVFSSISFLYFFLPAVLVMYYVIPWKYKNGLLLAASLFFYFWGEQATVFVMIGMALVGYGFGRLLGYMDQMPERMAGGWIPVRKTICILAAAGNGIVLAAFKYGWWGLELPAGISFFTFQIISYVADVYRRDVNVQNHPVDFLMYVSAFPQLIAGPIVRYKDMEGQIGRRPLGVGQIASGIRMFLAGLGKKVLIANELGALIQKLDAASASSYGGAGETVLGTWLGAVAFFFQIYYDFSGYSDMAVGLGRMLGFHFPDNFDYPYISASVTEFWRRWHKTLGGWFRDYVYIPLGGNRVSRGKWIRNVLIVWALTGIWHGASWNFLVWGLYFGCFLLLERLFLRPLLERLPKVCRHLYTLAVVFIGMIIFRGGTPGYVWEQLGRLLGLRGGLSADSYSLYYLKSYGRLLIVSVIGATWLPKRLYWMMADRCSRTGTRIDRVLSWLWPAAQALVCAGLLLWVTACLVGGSFNPFLYFRF